MVNPLIKAIGQAAKKPVKKGAEEAISKAAESAGMKAPVVAQKDLTTLQDFHTSLGDRIRAEAEATRRMMEGFDYKYDKGQRVFTVDSAAKNRAPYEILERTRVGNAPMREDHPTLGPGMGRPIIDPESGRARRTPYEPGYRVRSMSDEGEVYEFVIPASAIKGDVEFARGGKVHFSSNPDTMRMELEDRRFDKGGAAFGVFPQMRPRRSARSDVDPNVAIPRGLARGFVSGAAGAPGDIELLGRLLANTPGVQAYGEATGAATPGKYRQGEVGMKTRLPTSEEVEQMLPFRPENPSAMERAATGLGQIGGGFYTGPGAPIRAVTAVPSAVARAGRDFVMAAGQPAVNVVKPKGGNWLTGNIENKLQNLKVEYPNSPYGRTPEKVMEFLIKRHGEEGAEEILRSGMFMNPTIKEDIALNQWIDKTLGKYIKNEMGTPSDPVRRAVDKKFGEIEAKYARDMARSERTAERAAEETDPRRKGNLTRQAQREATEARQERQLAIENIYNSPGAGLYFGADRMRENAAKYSGPEYGTVMSTTPAGKAWEDATDALIGTSPAKTRLNFDQQVESSPWLKDLPPDTPVHHLSGGTREIAGFDHVVDILRQDLATGRLKPEDLNKMTVDQAVLRTGEYDKEMVKASREAQLKSTEGMPVYKEYPEQGMRWYELALGDLPPGYTREPSGIYVSPTGERSLYHPNYTKLEDALNYEGEVLSHCVGGYCPRVISGESQIFSLRNEAGQPFATVEVRPPKKYTEDDVMQQFPGGVTDALKKSGPKGVEEYVATKLAELNSQPPAIVQIKGFKNQAPDPSVRPLIQDFVRSGKWSDVGDIENTGLYRVDPQSDLAKALSAKGVEVPRYVTDDELTQFRSQMPPGTNWLKGSDEYKRGGRVHISSNPDTMRLELADKKMAGGGIAKALKEALKPLPRAAAKTKQEIEAIAERMAPQVLGEYVREKPKSAVTVAGKTKKQFEREKELPVDVRGETKTPETLDIEKLKGNVVIGIPGDPTITDKALHAVGDIRLESAAPQHGGPLYGLGRPDFWASGIGPATRVQNLAAEVAEQYGAPVLGKYVMMGPESINYAQHFADANLQAIDLSKMTRAQIDGFNDLIRRGSPKSGPRPSFPGIEDKGAAYLHFSVDPELRKHFNAVMQQPKVTEAFSLPSGQDIRFAITEPALRDLETGVTGFSLGRMKPGEGLKLSEHPTYSHDIPGEFLGQSRYPAPYELSFPDTLQAIRANPRQAPQEFGSLKMVGPRQIIDQQMIDELKTYEEAMKRLTGKKKGGVVKLAAGGLSKAAVEALTKMRGLSKEFAEKSAEYSKYIQETKKVPTKDLPSFEEWKALQINVTPQNIEQLRKETGNKRGGSIKKKR